MKYSEKKEERETEMSRQVRVAVVQMNPSPAPVEKRLKRASCLVKKAASDAAEIVVLPEVFNTGYLYDSSNYTLAEPADGQTVRWMRQTAARHDLHLAGSLMLRENKEIYDALLLFAPDGQSWRYDKRYPWGWERAYFRPGRGVTIAETKLGRIGMLICWDVAHLERWQAYAGQIDWMIVSSCPPDVPRSVYSFSDGSRLKLEDISPKMAGLMGSGQLVFGRMLSEQAAWLGVPVANAMGSGDFATPIPRSKALILIMSLRNPRLLRYLGHVDRIFLSCHMIPGCRVIDAQGQTLAEVPPQLEDALVVATIHLADASPKPTAAQPPSPLPRAAYALSDWLLPCLMLRLYRKGVRNVP